MARPPRACARRGSELLDRAHRRRPGSHEVTGRHVVLVGNVLGPDATEHDALRVRDHACGIRVVADRGPDLSRGRVEIARRRDRHEDLARQGLMDARPFGGQAGGQPRLLATDVVVDG